MRVGHPRFSLDRKRIQSKIEREKIKPRSTGLWRLVHRSAPARLGKTQEEVGDDEVGHKHYDCEPVVR